MSLNYKSLGILFSLNTVNVILNIAASTLMVYYFGTSRAIEAYFAATLLGTTIAKLAQTGQLTEIFVPKYHAIKAQKNQAEASVIFSVLVNYLFLFSAGLVVFFLLLKNTIITWLVPGFDAASQAQVYDLFRWTSVLIPFQVITSAFQGLLNAEKIYGKVELSYTFAVLTTIGIIVGFGPKYGASILVFSWMAGIVYQLVAVFYYLSQIGYRHRFVLQTQLIGLREILHLIGATSLYVLSVQAHVFLFNGALSLLPAGTFAIYRYAESIYGRLSMVILAPISVVFFNEINHQLTRMTTADVRQFVQKSLHFSFFICLLTFVVFWAGGQYLIWFLWGGQKFSFVDVQQVYVLLCVFFGVLTIQGFNTIYRKLGVSVSNPNFQYVAWSVAHVVSGLAAYSLIKGFGFQGLIAQTLLHIVLLTAVPIATVYLKKRVFFTSMQPAETWRIVGCFGVSLLWGVALQYLLPLTPQFSKVEALLAGGLVCAGAGLLFLGGGFVFKIAEMEVIRQKLSRWF